MVQQHFHKGQRHTIFSFICSDDQNVNSDNNVLFSRLQISHFKLKFKTSEIVSFTAPRQQHVRPKSQQKENESKFGQAKLSAVLETTPSRKGLPLDLVI
ncbi:hypothetical protein H5410_059417 [Solanum commersonii]|uniref:Uncharacterized protein n=1 Tax=Solanum commersonii TaxID=4109 RepID=A0A9J5W2B3_SOLCO|nr:hypothetical protein H5410_059417 [Solanum commersonii]